MKIWNFEQKKGFSKYFGIQICDFCGKKQKQLVQTDLDVGKWKCMEYRCESFICISCIKEAKKLIEASK